MAGSIRDDLVEHRRDRQVFGDVAPLPGRVGDQQHALVVEVVAEALLKPGQNGHDNRNAGSTTPASGFRR